MNLLDENIPFEQRDLLEAWGIRCRVIGQDIAELSIADENIIALMHHLKQPTLFTRDEHFFNRRLCHAAYGLVWLDAVPEEAAFFIRRLSSILISKRGSPAWGWSPVCITMGLRSGAWDTLACNI